jgi:hypothetical protein
LNVALGDNPDGDRQAIFFSLIDRLTPAHLRMLKFFDEETKGAASRTPINSAISLAKLHVPSLKNLGDPATRLLFDDLHRDGLLSVTSNNQGLIAPYKRWTSNWGHEFITFITAPKEGGTEK